MSTWAIRGEKRVFPREHFEELNRYVRTYLHLNDSERMPGRDQPGYDPLYKSRPLIQLCRHTFPEHYTPAKEMSIDEAMIRYRGRVFFRQYMPKNSIKWGITVWMLADAKKGFIFNFEVYLGRTSTSEKAEHRLCTRVVLDVSEPFHHSN